ncbi:hypothetical protein LXL04_014898 [Taraxacum kok-saghyz]
MAAHKMIQRGKHAIEKKTTPVAPRITQHKIQPIRASHIITQLLLRSSRSKGSSQAILPNSPHNTRSASIQAKPEVDQVRTNFWVRRKQPIEGISERCSSLLLLHRSGAPLYFFSVGFPCTSIVSLLLHLRRLSAAIGLGIGTSHPCSASPEIQLSFSAPPRAIPDPVSSGCSFLHSFADSRLFEHLHDFEFKIVCFRLVLNQNRDKWKRQGQMEEAGTNGSAGGQMEVPGTNGQI